MQNKNNTAKKNTVIWLQLFSMSLMLFYTLHININSTKGYGLMELQETRSVLFSKEEELNLKISRAQNFKSLENNLITKDMKHYWNSATYYKKKSKLAKN